MSRKQQNASYRQKPNNSKEQDDHLALKTCPRLLLILSSYIHPESLFTLAPD